MAPPTPNNFLINLGHVNFGSLFLTKLVFLMELIGVVRLATIALFREDKKIVKKLKIRRGKL